MVSFENALKENNINAIVEIPKSDHHNHATRGGNIRDFIDNVDELPTTNFNSLYEMQSWYESNVKYLFNGKEGFISRIKSAFNQAKNDGITNLTLSFGMNDTYIFDNLNDFINAIDSIQKIEAPGINFIPEISFSREQNIEVVTKLFNELIEFNFFKSIDLVGDDTSSVAHYKKIYKKAKNNDFILKAHLGEFGNAQSIIEGIKILELDQVQHGINAVNSKSIIKYIKDRNIQLNICPSSNIMLNRSKSYKEHQIKKLFHEGIKVTINTDDMLIFDKSISQEYLNLYNSKCLSANELNIIRINGIRNQTN